MDRQSVEFRDNVELEVMDMIKRLRNHPSIFLWGGGNENIMGWEFGKGYKPAPGKDLFESMIPELVNRLDPLRPYHPSSPWGGPHSNYPLKGDWHDYTTLKIVPLSSVPLYASEVCRVSAYSIRSMKRFLSEEELWPDGFQFTVDKPGKIAWPEMWQYRSAGSAWQKLGKIEDFCDPQSAADLVRITGIAHGEYLQKRVEALPGVTMAPVEATYLAWLDVGGLGLDDPIAHFESHGLGFSDGREFSGSGFVRLNFGCTRATLQEACDRLARAVAAAG